MPYTPIIFEPLCVQVAADGQVPTHAAEHTSEADGRRNTMFSGGLNGCMVEKRHILSHSSWIFMDLHGSFYYSYHRFFKTDFL
jgi:hypothetical protein